LRLVEEGATRRQLVVEAVAVLDRYAAALPEDGACDEGHDYWWHGPCRLLEALALLRHATCGKLDAFSIERLRRTVAFPHNTHLGGPWFVNHADASASPGPEHPWHALCRLGALTGDQAAMNHARVRRLDLGLRDATWPAPPADSLGRVALALADRRWLHAPAAESPLPASAWYASTEVMVARERAGSASGLAVAAKGGHNGERHNHNDVGSAVVALDGTPFLVDAGRPTYTAQTFGPDRYTMWALRSDWHNVPLIRGQGQGTGTVFRARRVTAVTGEAQAVFEADLANAYDAPGLATWRRRVSLDRKSRVVAIIDSWRWLAGEEEAVELRFLLAGRVLEAAPGHASIETLSGGLAMLTWPVGFGFSVVERDLDDPRHSRVWGERLTQLRLDPRGASESELACREQTETKRSSLVNVLPAGG
jgi:hypothetical protein